MAEARTRRLRKNIHVRAIHIETKNVFDPSIPGEHYWPYRVANSLHIRTRAQVIRRELLVRPGEYTHEELLEESERKLRALFFIKDAKIIEQPASQGEVDLLVRTQDTWTTQPQINFGSEGGQSKYSAGILEENLLGYGKSISYFYRSNPDGVSHEFGYGDPQLFNTRSRLSALFLDTPTGNEQHLTLARPFFSRETRAAAGLTLNHSQALQKVFEGGSEISRYDLERLDLSPFAGVRLNEDLDNVQRLNLSYLYSEDVFKAEAATPPGTLPSNKALSGPNLLWSLDQADFIKETFIDKAERVEDINLGHQVSVGTGYYGRKLGGSQNALPFSAFDAYGFGGQGDWFGLASYGTTGRYMLYADGQTGGRLAHALYFLNLNYYRHLLPEFPLTGVAHLETAYAQNPDVGNPLSLGGDTGLRGFKVNAFTGNKSLLLNLENRFFIPYEVLRLAYLGGAVFFDAGQVQPQGMGFNGKDFHTNIGVGLRVGLSRSTEGTIFRLDVAYALGPLQQDDRIIVSITSGQGFKRAGNTYSSFEGAPDH